MHNPFKSRLGIAACALFAVFALISSTAMAQNTIQLGAVVSLTGDYSTLGKLTRDGYDVAIKRINSQGGVKVDGKTYKLQVKYYDDESTSARAAQLAERMIKRDNIKFVLGPYGSTLTKAVAPVTEKYHVPMVEGNGAARSLFKQGYKYLFATLNTSDYYLRPAITLAAEQAKANGTDPSSLKVAFIMQNDDFSQDVRDGAAALAKKKGMKIVLDEKLPPGLNDMSSTLTKVKALHPDVLLVSGHSKGAALAVGQIADTKTYAKMIALTHCGAGGIVEKYGKNANYMLCATQWDSGLTYKGKWFKSPKAFAQVVKKQGGYDHVPYQVAESAAAVEVFANAFQNAGSLDKKKVRDAIANTDMTTFYGPIKFDDSGKNTAKSMAMYQVQHQKYKVVAPSKSASNDVIYPMPKWSQR